MTGKEYEDIIADLLDQNKIKYIREGAQIRYGGKSSKGKYDFDIKGYSTDAIEAKVVQGVSRLSYPRPNVKYASIKTHQLKALRACHNGIVLVRDSMTDIDYCIKPTDIDKIIIDHGLVASLGKYITDNQINLAEYIGGIKFIGE